MTKKHRETILAEKGCRAVYSAIEEPTRRSGRPVEASVYCESCSGRIAATYHNNQSMFSASKYALIPHDAFRGERIIKPDQKFVVIYEN